MARTEKEIKLLESVGGVFMSILEKLLKLLVKKGVSFALIRRLATEEGEPLLEQIADAVVSGIAPKPHERWRVWRSVTLGLHRGADEYLEALACRGFGIHSHARDISKKMECVDKPKSVRLVIVSLGDLGLWSGQYDEVCLAAKKQGLEPCPAEAIFALCLGYCDGLPMSRGELILGMQPIANSNGRRLLFSLSGSNEITSFHAFCDGVWEGVWTREDRLVFCLPTE